MPQSHKQSWCEAIANTIIGYVVNIAVNAVVFPLFGIALPLHANLLMGLVYTVVSVVRGYSVRRLFNWIGIQFEKRKKK